MAVSQPEGGPRLLLYLRISKAGPEILGPGWSSPLSLAASPLPFRWKTRVGEGEGQLGVPSAVHAGLRHRQVLEGSLLSSLSVWAPFPSLLSSRGKGACLVNSGQCTISSACAPSFRRSSRSPPDTLIILTVQGSVFLPGSVQELGK